MSHVFRPLMKILLFALLLTWLVPGSLQAAVIRVPQDFSTIQGAIDAAVNGDTVRVAPGTYIENIDFLGKAITVASETGPDVTIIDGSSSVAGSVVSFTSGEGPTSVLNGFTVQNGDASEGGGVTISQGKRLSRRPERN